MHEVPTSQKGATWKLNGPLCREAPTAGAAAAGAAAATAAAAAWTEAASSAPLVHTFVCLYPTEGEGR